MECKGVMTITNKRSDQDILKFMVDKGIISLNDIEEEMRLEERTRLLQKHKNKIFYYEKKDCWRTYVRDNHGRKLIERKNKNDLEEYLISLYSEEEDLEYECKVLKSIRTLYPEWLKYKSLHTASPSSIRRIQNDWNRYYENDQISDIPIPNLTYLTLDEWVQKKIVAEKMTKKQYMNMITILKNVLLYATEPELGIIDKSPFERVKVNSKLFRKTEIKQSSKQIFTQEEQDKLIDSCYDSYYHNNKKSVSALAIVLNFNLGLRVGELVAIRWGDISNDGYLYIRRAEISDYELTEECGLTRKKPKVVDFLKTPAGERKIYLNQKALDVFKELRQRNKQFGIDCGDNSFVFINKQTNERLTSSGLCSMLYKYCQNAGIEKKSSHKIRKTFISELFDIGMNIESIREIAGHEDERTTLHSYIFDRSTKSDIEKYLDDL